MESPPKLSSCIFVGVFFSLIKLQTTEEEVINDSEYLAPPEHSWTAITGEGGETAVVGQGVDKVDVSVSKPVEAEYEEVIASSTDGLPFRNSLRRRGKRAHRGTHYIYIPTSHMMFPFSSNRGYLFYYMVYYSMRVWFSIQRVWKLIRGHH